MAGKSLANSLSPSQGMDVNGPTAVINSINKIPMDYMGNGGVLDMKFLPVLSELFSSDSIIFMIIGFVIAVIISMKISGKRKGFVGMAAGLSVYAVCEIILNIRTNNVLEIGLLFAGTVALGLCLGFLIGTVLLMKKQL